jgi:hypothetical protein
MSGVPTVREEDPLPARARKLRAAEPLNRPSLHLMNDSPSTTAPAAPGPAPGRTALEYAGGALRVAAAVALLALVSLLTFVPPGQNDFWLQAAVGRIIVETGDIPRTVLFPFTWAQHNAFYPHEWLPSVFFFSLIEHLGYERILFVQGLLGLLLLSLTFGLTWRLSRSVGAALLLTIATTCDRNCWRSCCSPCIFTC